jgi:putative pyruvate formate lyase activating enzyme
MKYGDSLKTNKYSKIPDYVEINQVVVNEMYRRIGNLTIDTNGIAAYGLLVRHLILPESVAQIKLSVF